MLIVNKFASLYIWPLFWCLQIFSTLYVMEIRAVQNQFSYGSTLVSIENRLRDKILVINHTKIRFMLYRSTF